MNRTSRRNLLRGLAVGTLTGAAGCIGRSEPSCDSFASVLALQTTVVRIYLPVESDREARVLAAAFEADGYVVTVGDEIELRGNADAIVVEVIGDLTREDATSEIQAVGLSEYELQVRDLQESSISAVSGEPRFPWQRPVLQRRADYLRAAAGDLDLSLPPFRASQLRVGVDATAARRVAAVRRLFEPGGRLTATLRPPDGSVSDPAAFRTGISPRRQIDGDGVRLKQARDGVTVTAPAEPADRYARAMFDPVWPGTRPSGADTARVVFRLDGQEELRRRLTSRERHLFEWFDEHPGGDPPKSVGHVPLVLPDLEPEVALRIAGALTVPTGTRNAFEGLCD